MFRSVLFWSLIALAVFGVGWLALAFDAKTDGMAGMKKLIRTRFPAVQHIQPAELALWLMDTNRPAPQLLDVRGQAEFEVSHLPGARRVEPDAKADQVLPLLSKERPVVVYCSVGYRSSELATRLLKAGFSNIVNLEGSIFQWANEDRPLEANDQPATVVHPYNDTFGRLLKPERRPSTPDEGDAKRAP